MAAYVRRGVDGQAPRHRVVALVAAPSGQVASVVGGWGRATPVDATSCRLVIDATALPWAAMLLGIVGAPFTVVEPPELRTTLGAIGALFTAAAQPPESPRWPT